MNIKDNYSMRRFINSVRRYSEKHKHIQLGFHTDQVIMGLICDIEFDKGRSPWFKEDVVRRTLFSTDLKLDFSFRDLERELKKQNRNVLHEPKSVFRYVVPLSVKGEFPIESISHRGCLIQFKLGEDFKQRATVGRREILALIPYMELNSTEDYLLSCITVHAYHFQDAMHFAMNAFDEVRALFSVYLNLNRFVGYYNARPKPLNNLCIGQLYSFHNEHGDADLSCYSYEPNWTHRGKLLNFVSLTDADGTETAMKYLGRLKEKTSFSNFLFDCLTLYCRALDTDNYHQSFVQLWLTMEKITCLPLARSDLLTKRMLSFFNKDQFDIVRMWIELLKDLRNELIHHGKTKSDNLKKIAEIAKGIVEHALIFLVENKLEFLSVAELILFLDQSREESVIQAELKAITRAQLMNGGNQVPSSSETATTTNEVMPTGGPNDTDPKDSAVEALAEDQAPIVPETTVSDLPSST